MKENQIEETKKEIDSYFFLQLLLLLLLHTWLQRFTQESYTKYMYVYNDYTPFNNYLVVDTGTQPNRKKSCNEIH